MGGPLDMNGHPIINAGRSTAQAGVPTIGQLQDFSIYSGVGKPIVFKQKIQAEKGISVPKSVGLQDAVNAGSIAGILANVTAASAPPEVANASDLGAQTGLFARDQHTHSGVNLDQAQTITAVKTFNTSAGHAPFAVAGGVDKVTNLNADQVDGYDAGNASGNVSVSNGTVNTNLNADMVDGHHAGNASGNVPISNGTVCTTLNADQWDGQDYTTGTFTITATGFTTTVTATAIWVKLGSVVALFIPLLTGTSNATTMTWTGIPAAIQPSTATFYAVLPGANNSVDGFVTVRINSGSGTWDLFADAHAGAWAAAQTKSTYATNITYILS
jgi:hypothetical protein